MGGMLVNDEGVVMLFRDYILSESIRPRYTEYGTDLKNRQWNHHNEGYFTFYEGEQYIYCVMITDKGNVGFFTSNKDVDVSNIKLPRSVFDSGFTFEKRTTERYLKTFNRSFYVILEGVNKFKIDEVKFSGADINLSITYESLVKNKFFLDVMRQEGFEYKGFILGDHTFIRSK